MKDINEFLNIHYNDAINLCNDFETTKEKKWTPLLYLNELYVQIGHVYNVINNDKYVNEPQRKFDNLGDEISDILLQLINLSASLNVNMLEIKKEKNTTISDFNMVPILLGQLSEIIMEQFGYRFRKERVDYNSSFEFVKSRIFRIFIITCNFSKKNSINIKEEFKLMIDDANNFLLKFDKSSFNKTEFIDIYDENQKYLGYSEKLKAHQLGYWHKTFNCLFINPKSNKVYFQLKKSNYNPTTDKNVLVLTVGGHLKAGEVLNDGGIREIKEETGINVDFNYLIPALDRKVNKKIRNDYILKEFQYYYLYLSNSIKLTDFDKYEDEVAGFVELDINSAIMCIKNRCSVVGKMITKNKTRMIEIDINSFDKNFVEEDDLIIKLLDISKSHIDDYNKKTHIFHKFKLNRKINVLRRSSYSQDNLIDFGDLEVCKVYDVSKDEMKYSVMKLSSKRIKNYYVCYVLVVHENKFVPYLLMKHFDSESDADFYFDYLCNYIQNETNEAIFNKCYLENFTSSHKDFMLW